jgi:hypothetical protein
MLHKAVIWQGKKCKQKNDRFLQDLRKKFFSNLVDIFVNFKKNQCRIIRLNIISSGNCKGSAKFISGAYFCQYLVSIFSVG